MQERYNRAEKEALTFCTSVSGLTFTYPGSLLYWKLTPGTHLSNHFNMLASRDKSPALRVQGCLSARQVNVGDALSRLNSEKRVNSGNVHDFIGVIEQASTKMKN